MKIRETVNIVKFARCNRQLLKQWLTALTVFLLLFCCMFTVVHAQGRDQGKVDWVNGYVVATGYGTAKPGMTKAEAYISAARRAKMDAMRNLLEAVKAVQIDSHTLVSNFMTSQDRIRTRVHGLLKGAEVIGQHTEWVEGLPLVTVRMRVCLNAQSSKCQPGNTILSTLPLDKLRNSPWLPRKDYFQEASSEPPKKPKKLIKAKIDYNYDPQKPVSGLVLSLRGHPFKKVVLPVVVTKSKSDGMSTIYSVKHVNPRIVRVHGIVRYSDSLKYSLQIKRLGDNILVLPVEAVSADNLVVLATEGAQKIYETTRHGNNYLEEAKVVISLE